MEAASVSLWSRDPVLTEVSGSVGLVSNVLHFRASRNRCWKRKTRTLEWTS